jgi:hypothetical protein
MAQRVDLGCAYGSGVKRGLVRIYERAAFIWDAGGDALTLAVVESPKIHAPTPISKNKVNSATEMTAKL